MPQLSITAETTTGSANTFEAGILVSKTSQRAAAVAVYSQSDGADTCGGTIVLREFCVVFSFFACWVRVVRADASIAAEQDCFQRYETSWPKDSLAKFEDVEALVELSSTVCAIHSSSPPFLMPMIVRSRCRPLESRVLVFA